MLDILLGILVIVAVLVTTAILLLLYALIRIIPETRRIRKFIESATTRRKLSDSEFCQCANLPEADRYLVRGLRVGLGKHLKIDPEFIYPEDEISSYGFQYDDCVSGFVYSCGLISKDPYWFDMEEGSTIRSVVLWIHRINNEQGDANFRATTRE